MIIQIEKFFNERVNFFRTSPFKVVKFRMNIGYFNLDKNQNLIRGFNLESVKQCILYIG